MGRDHRCLELGEALTRLLHLLTVLHQTVRCLGIVNSFVCCGDKRRESGQILPTVSVEAII